MNRFLHDNLDAPKRAPFRESIHPYGRLGTDMCRLPKPATINRKIRGREDHCERHPNDKVAAAHLAKLNALLESIS